MTARTLAVLTALVLAAVAVPEAASAGSSTSRDAAIGFVLDRGRIDRIDLPGDGSFTVLARITGSGRIVGKTPDQDGVGFDGLVGDRRKLRRLEFPGAMATYVQGIDERGRIVGDASRGPSVIDPGATGFLLDRGRYTRIAYPGAVYTQAFGINNRGHVVGEYLDQDGVFHGYLWKNGRFETFDGPTGTSASVTDINDRGDMVGAYVLDPSNPFAGARGFLLRKGRYTTFAVPGFPITLPFDINNRGQIAGLTGDVTEGHGFLLAEGADGPVAQIDVPGAPRTSVYGLDDRGRLIGVYENPNAAPSAQRSRAAAMPLLDALPLGLADAR
jgi:probable HAF family extracellular repeat protein